MLKPVVHLRQRPHTGVPGAHRHHVGAEVLGRLEQDSVSVETADERRNQSLSQRQLGLGQSASEDPEARPLPASYGPVVHGCSTPLGCIVIAQPSRIVDRMGSRNTDASAGPPQPPSSVLQLLSWALAGPRLTGAPSSRARQRLAPRDAIVHPLRPVRRSCMPRPPRSKNDPVLHSRPGPDQAAGRLTNWATCERDGIRDARLEKIPSSEEAGWCRERRTCRGARPARPARRARYGRVRETPLDAPAVSSRYETVIDVQVTVRPVP